MADFDEYEYLEKQLDKRNGRENGHEEEKKRKDRDRHRHKHSSREHGEKERRHRSGDRDDRKRRHRSRSREHRPEKQRTRDPSPKRREKTPPEVKEQRERERELRELDRDTRTVFAYNLNLKADERDIFEFFSKAGKVVDVRIIMDRNTRKSKGFAYIEFQNREDIVNALALTGQVLMGQAVMVKNSEAEKNLAWEANQQQNSLLAQMNALAGQAALASGTGPCKLYVGNLHVNITEADLRQIFEPFGAIDMVSLQKEGGRSQGFGFVQFRQMPDATKAIQQLDGLEIAGAAIQVKIAAMLPTDQALGVNDLDDDEEDGGGMKLTSHARAALMNRLAGNAGVGGTGANTIPLGQPAFPGFEAPAAAAPPAQPQINPALQLEQGILGPGSPIATVCLLLKNMFNPEEETDPNWNEDIAEDVKEECSKYGPVVHIHVDGNSKGFVYLKFANQDGAMAAQKALHGRWFAGRQVVAEYQFAQVYNNHFKC